MLTEIRIENFAIIEDLELTFVPGLNILTGETGAGKSIIIDAVEVILGGRADLSMVRTDSERAIVEAIFEISDAARPDVQAILEKESLMDESDRSSPANHILVMSREVRRNGRSVARVNGRSVNVGLLAELGSYLVDVHGQSEHLSLLHVRHHLGLLDRFANNADLVEAYRRTYHILMEVEGRLDELRMVESEAARRVDILTYQINEIDSARLRPGEEEELREERNRLANAEGIASLAQEAVQLLDEGTPDFQAATDLLGQVVSALHNLTRLDPTQSVLAEQAQQAEEMLAELASNLRSYVDEIEFNPRRLDQVEERLNLFYTLKKKYGADLQAVLAYADDARRQLDAIVHAGEKIAELEAEVAKLLECLAKEAKALSDSRHAAAERLESTLSDELEALSMPGARLKVDFQTHSRSATSTRPGLLLEDGRQVAFDANGFERVEFLVAVNPGEGLKPLVKTASGGETSRLMLAIKNVLAQADTIPTLIFDEIDQGIGGRVGTMVGRKLWNLARQHQVLCVTHLPQLAAFGDQHLRVRKEIVAGRTITQVDAVHGEARELEIAQMMGEVSQVTRLSAQELLQSVAHSVPSPTIRDG